MLKRLRRVIADTRNSYTANPSTPIVPRKDLPLTCKALNVIRVIKVPHDGRALKVQVFPKAPVAVNPVPNSAQVRPAVHLPPIYPIYTLYSTVNALI